MKRIVPHFKNILKCCIPIIIFFFIDLLDDFRGFKEIYMLINRNVAEASITQNGLLKYSQSPNFYDENGDFDYFKLENELVAKNEVGKPILKYSYQVGTKNFVDSLYYIDSSSDGITEWDENLSTFLENEKDSSVGSTFKVYYYKGFSKPVSVVNGVIAQKGLYRTIFFNSYFGLWAFAMVFSLIFFLGIYYPNKK